MRAPTARYVVRWTGCGPYLGVILIGVGTVIILSHYGYLPERVTKWWPVLVIGVGVLLFLRHYYRQYSRRPRPNQVFDPGAPIRTPFSSSKVDLRPPFFPVLVMAVGVYLLLRYPLHAISLWVVLAIILICLGVMLLAGNIRGSINRT